ncbi:MAG: 1-acyl-sn-glycerol-3-phosphate acyltransferase [Alphaproteobacteria bacterium]|nr:1-acyl-sn-glycerol-3-phosphate acyltransferase [Alphaproteobacteria bacterium]
MRRYVSLLRIGAGFLWSMVLAVPVIPIALVLFPWRGLRVRLGNLYAKIVARVGIWLSMARPDLRHRERLDGNFPAIYICNHCSNLDILFAMWLTPYGGCGIAKKEIARIPFFGWLYYLSGHLLIDRGDAKKAVASMNEIAQAVHTENLGIWIWPEGTRSRDGRLLPFKKGLAHLALATKLPIVPLVVHDAHKNWKAKRNELTALDVRIDVLEPIPTADWTGADIGARLAEVWALYADGLGEDQKPSEESREKMARMQSWSVDVESMDTENGGP